jgi:dUTP pyrophosphatase
LGIAEDLLFRKQYYTGEDLLFRKQDYTGKDVIKIGKSFVTFHVEDGQLTPYKKHFSDAGWDLRAKESFTLAPHEWRVIKTGVRTEIPQGYVGIIKERSGLGAKGLAVRAGVIDSDYRGEIGVVIQNLTNDQREFEEGDRIAQLVVMNCLLDAVIKFDGEITETERGEGGFGSTGIQ